MLEVTALRKSFAGFVAVNDVSFTVETQQIAAVIGPNGAGKSTLFNLITGHLAPDSGTVVLDGNDITGVLPHKICGLGLGRSFQRTNIFPRLSVFENVQAAYLVHRGRGRDFWSRAENFFRDETAALLASIGLQGRENTVGRERSATATRSSSNWGSRWRAIRRCCCSTSRPPACRRPKHTTRSASSSASPANGR